MAEEQARQAERQAQDLMEGCAKIKAEKEELKRCNEEMAARLQLYEGILCGPEEPADIEEENFYNDDEIEACSSPEYIKAYCSPSVQ